MTFSESRIDRWHPFRHCRASRKIGSQSCFNTCHGVAIRVFKAALGSGLDVWVSDGFSTQYPLDPCCNHSYEGIPKTIAFITRIMVMTWMVGDTPMTSETSIHVSQQMFEGLQPLRGHAQG